MIDIQNISFKYPGSKHLIFDDFSMTIEPGRILGLLGKNGTGKSTLLYLISGLLRPSAGKVTMDNVLTSKRLPETLSKIFIVPEEFNLPSVSLDTYVKINRPFYPKFSQKVLEECLKDFELPLSIKLSELSMGQKKKVYMSFALAAGTDYLFMDEPTNGLDIPSKAQFRRVITNHMTDNRTLIISTHQVHDIEPLLDHVVILSQTKMLLNASMTEIADKYRFDFRQPQDMDESVLYAEPTLQGNAVITYRQEGEPETPINIEILFNYLNR